MRATQPSRRRIYATGERGTLEWDGIEGTVTQQDLGTPGRIIRATQPRDAMYTAQAGAFLDACAGMPEPRLASSEHGVHALAICDAARAASQAQREIAVEYP